MNNTNSPTQSLSYHRREVRTEMSSETPRLVLWGHANFRSGRNLWMLEELGLPFSHRPIRARTAEAETPEFRAVSPRGKIPVLEDGDFALTESAAINTYLCDQYGGQDAGLVPPAGTRMRAQYDSWLFTITTELDAQALYIHRKHVDLACLYGEAPTAVEAARAYFSKQLESVQAVLRSSRSILGSDAPSAFTAADLLLTDVLVWAKKIAWLPDDDAHLTDYVARNTARPAYQRAFPFAKCEKTE